MTLLHLPKPLSRFVLSIALVGALVAGACTDDDPAAATTGLGSGTQQPIASATGASGSSDVLQVGSLSDLVARVSPSVVLIQGTANQGDVSGTGVVIDREGHILTNNHVVDGVSNIKVTLPDGRASRAVLVGSDPDNDLAVIRADGFSEDALSPATLGNSDTVRPGDTVFAIGNPFSQTFSVTSGIVSAVGRASQSSNTGRLIQGMLQTDAALNPGNSGGPLFNLAGEVIGINTSIENPEGRVFAGLGFAVPSNTALRFLPQMLAGEEIQHAQLGVTLQALDEVVAEDLGVRETRGLYVTGVNSGSAAERAGILAGDVILAVNGEETHAFTQLGRAVDTADVGDEVTVLLSRNGQQQTVRAILQPWDLR